MKQQICIVFLVLTVTAAVFGKDFSISVGGGGLLGGFFTRYSLAADGIVEGAQVKIDAAQEMNQFNYGLYAFFDMYYGVFSVLLRNGINNFNETADVSALRNNVDQTGKGWDSALGLCILGKYPFNLNKKISVFPMLGLEYQIALKQKRTQADGWVYNRNDGLREKDKDGNAYQTDDWNAFWVKLGGGMDFMLPANFFIRIELLYDFRLMTPYESKNLDLMKAQAGDPDPKLKGLTSGPSLRIGAGRRLLSNGG